MQLSHYDIYEFTTDGDLFIPKFYDHPWIYVEGAGGGGGGASGAGGSINEQGGGGGGGGGGSFLQLTALRVRPNITLGISIGAGGAGGPAVPYQNGGLPGLAGGNGVPTTISGPVRLTIQGGTGGGVPPGGGAGLGAGGAGGAGGSTGGAGASGRAAGTSSTGSPIQGYPAGGGSPLSGSVGQAGGGSGNPSFPFVSGASGGGGGGGVLTSLGGNTEYGVGGAGGRGGYGLTASGAGQDGKSGFLRIYLKI